MSFKWGSIGFASCNYFCLIFYFLFLLQWINFGVALTDKLIDPSTLFGDADLWDPLLNMIFWRVTRVMGIRMEIYRQVSNIRLTKSQNWSDSRPVLQLALLILLKTHVKSRMKMYLEQRRQGLLQLHLSDQQFNCQLGCVLLDLTVVNLKGVYGDEII